STSQQHDYKNAELRRSKDEKIPEIEGGIGKLPKTHNICSITTADTSRQVSERQHKNINLNKLFEKPFTLKISKNLLITKPQTSTYADNLHHDKKTSNHITLYIYDGEEISGMPELHKAFITYKRVTKENLFYIKFYTAPAEILYEEIKPPIQVVNIGLTKDMIIPEDIGQQSEIQKIEIPNFYANKRIISISTIIHELANNYLNRNVIWKERPTTRALKTEFISAELLTRYCKLIGHKYPDHICSKCNEEDNVIPDVQLE
ncbi:hypothetical protein H5410_027271, partial [Solanum commersonii]